MSAKQHLKELQFRLMVVAAFFIVGATLAYMYQDKIIPFLLAPIGNEKLIYLNPGGGFSFIFLVSIYAGVALAFPFLIQQVYGFLRPALPASAQKKSGMMIIGSLFLLLAGIAFGYYIAVPNALHFLYGFADQYVDASLTADSYLNFVIAYTIGIGIVFQIPLLLLLIHAAKPLKPSGLMRSERWVILISFIIAAFITPTPDPVNQTIIAGPVIIVYQIGVFIILWSIMKQRRADKRKAKDMVRRARRIQQPPHPVYSEPALDLITPLSTAVVNSSDETPEVEIEQPVEALEAVTTIDTIEATEAVETPHQAQSLEAELVLEQELEQELQHTSEAELEDVVEVETEATPTPSPQRQFRPVDGFNRVPRSSIQPVARIVPAHQQQAQTQVSKPSVGQQFSSDGIIRQRVAGF